MGMLKLIGLTSMQRENRRRKIKTSSKPLFSILPSSLVIFFLSDLVDCWIVPFSDYYVSYVS